MTVNAVVNVENVQTIELRGSGGSGSFDPFEFFFGPQQRQQQQQSEPQTRSQRSGGSGVIISSDGYIVTNNHVVDKADELNITLYNGKSYKATLIGTDPSTDIALIKIDEENLPVLQFGDSDDLRLGEWVLAVGNPMGLTSTVTAGIISAKGRSLGASQSTSSTLDIESFIQTDAVVNPGNSGGALVTTQGRLIGINTILKSNTGSYIGYSFAVPSSIVRKVVADLREFGAVQRAMLGIAYAEITPQWLEKYAEELNVDQNEGLYVAEVQDEGAAKEAGIRKNDVIVALNDTPIRTSAALQEGLAKLRPGDKIKISVKRSGQMKHFDVILRNRAGETELLAKDAVDVAKLLGGEFQTPNAATLKKLGIKGGLQVVSLSADGLLAKSRVRTGFIITHVNERPVSSVSDLNRITDTVSSIDGYLPDGRQVIYQIVNN
ncbi:MAG: trypsin-like peptidase domain-containing protein, partial [Rikenellaceae bacterium]